VTTEDELFTVVDLYEGVRLITKWLDDANEPGPHEDAMRVLKLAEEVGEAVEAYIGFTGQNPRKGVTHTGLQFYHELIDVAVTALCALQHFTQDDKVTRAYVEARVRATVRRAGLVTEENATKE
jgi:hypothetical protein